VEEALEGNKMVQTNKHWNESMPSHENIVYACFGGLSNTGITAALASLEAVKELGLAKVSIGCLAGLSTKVPQVIGKKGSKESDNS
jgi:hypothetical protein